MDKRVLHVFLVEVERQCRFAMLAYQDLQQAIQTHDMDRIWYSVQAFLIAAGNASKLLWPSHTEIPDRGSELRASLGVHDASPLEPRAFRNHFEHFDERLEQWATSSQRHNFVDSNVGPLSAIGGIDPTDCLRNLDPTSFALTYRGDTYALKPVAEAAQTLWQGAVEAQNAL